MADTISKFFAAFEGRSLYDPVTVAIAIDESIAEYQQIGIAVDCYRDIGKTMLTADRNNVGFCEHIDSSKFFELFYKCVLD